MDQTERTPPKIGLAKLNCGNGGNYKARNSAQRFLRLAGKIKRPAGISTRKGFDERSYPSPPTDIRPSKSDEQAE